MPEVLTNLGDKAYETGSVDIEVSSYMKVSIDAYTEALKVYTLERFPIQYAMTQNNLGNVFGILAGVEEKAENCRKAMSSESVFFELQDQLSPTLLKEEGNESYRCVVMPMRI